MNCYVSEHNLHLVDVGRLFDDVIETSIINRLKEHQLLLPHIKLRNKDTLKIIYHYVTYHICEHIKNITQGKVILCMGDNDLNREIFEYCDKNDMVKLLRTLLKKIQRIIPITFVELKGVNSMREFCDGILSGKGEYIEQFGQLLSKLSKRQKKEYSLKDAKRFTSQYELHFLNRTYFNQLKVKSSLAIR